MIEPATPSAQPPVSDIHSFRDSISCRPSKFGFRFFRKLAALLILLSALAASDAAEKAFKFSTAPLNQTPPGFRSSVSGEGQPGDWKVILDEVPSAFAPITPQASDQNKRAVLAQLARDRTDEHFPLLIYEEEVFGDFKLTTKFKVQAGEAEQMAGIAFRLQDEKNYYYIRASALGNNVRFFKVVNGQRSEPIGAERKIPKGTWQELAIECQGNRIQCWLNGEQILPALTDNSFSHGKIAFWTKSDSVSYFTDTTMRYTPRVSLAELLVKQSFAHYPRLVGLQIYAFKKDGQSPQIIATNDSAEVGKNGGKIETDVIRRGVTYYGKAKGNVVVTLPLHDHNGDAVAAVRVTMKSFPGQTENNVLARAMPIIRDMELRTRAEPLVE